ncbi:hypothetical protein N7451_010698 [Penicillium sp. IBT 35674x]|nr:hypothetical protein N7451_010698 [Penicillium sp. IBT 35674x]
MVRDQLERKEDITQGGGTHAASPTSKTESPDLVLSMFQEARETGEKEYTIDKEKPEKPLPHADKCTCKIAPRRPSRADDLGDEIVNGSDEEAFFEDNNITRTDPSRPQTPIIDYDLDPDNLPWYLVHYEYYCDLSRSCEPVKLSAMQKDYRTTREKSNWIYLKGEHPVTIFLWFGLVC